MEGNTWDLKGNQLQPFCSTNEETEAQVGKEIAQPKQQNPGPAALEMGYWDLLKKSPW